MVSVRLKDRSDSSEIFVSEISVNLANWQSMTDENSTLNSMTSVTSADNVARLIA
jgi:hypothetical protein